MWRHFRSDFCYKDLIWNILYFFYKSINWSSLKKAFLKLNHILILASITIERRKTMTWIWINFIYACTAVQTWIMCTVIYVYLAPITSITSITRTNKTTRVVSTNTAMLTRIHSTLTDLNFFRLIKCKFFYCYLNIL